MEQYVNEDTIIKDSQYEAFKDMIFCPICECLMIEPVMCFTCQNQYCKKCLNDWKSRNNTCPNRCQNPIFKEVIGKNCLISKFKFNCIKGCGAEIPFEDINNHYSSDCVEMKKKIESYEIIDLEPKNENSKITILTKEEAELRVEKGKKIERMTSKNYYFI